MQEKLLKKDEILRWRLQLPCFKYVNCPERLNNIANMLYRADNLRTVCANTTTKSTEHFDLHKSRCHFGIGFVSRIFLVL